MAAQANEALVNASTRFAKEAFRFDKVQVSWQDPPGVWHNLSVTEVAIRTPEPAIGMGLLNQRLAGVTGNVALRLGLARGWSGPQGSHSPKRCYLQLNGLIVPA